MLNTSYQLGGTGRVDAVVHHLILRLHYRLPADGAGLRHLKDLLVPGPEFLDRTHHLRYDVPRPLDDDRIAFTDVLAMDVLFVVQSSVADGHATDVHGFQFGVGVEGARPPHIDADSQQLGDPFVGGELVRDGPPWSVGDLSQGELLCEAVNLDHYTVGLVVQCLPLIQPLLMESQSLLEIIAELDIVRCGETHPSQERQRLPLTFQRHSLHVPHGVHEDAQRAREGDGRI